MFEEFKDLFISSAREHIEALNSNLLSLEADPENQEVAFELYRHAHSLKGASFMAGFEEIGKLSHAMEEALRALKEGKVRPSPEVFDLLFAALDKLRELVDKAERGLELEDAAELSEELLLLGREGRAPHRAARGERLAFSGALRLEARRAERLYSLIREFKLLGEERRRIFQDLISELEALRRGGDRRGVLERMESLRREMEEAHFFEQILLSDLETEAEHVALAPLSVFLMPLRRKARDLAREYGKEVELSISGGDLRVDRRIVEKLSDPLVHLLRNAIDHGIEPPEERERAGKPQKGNILISLESRGEKLLLSVRDDGRGIDWEEIGRRALEEGLISPGEEGNREILQDVLTRPGFTTSREATPISGRGMGLDVVRRAVEELGGAMEIESERGRGTTFILRLPLKLGAMRALLVRVNGFLYAVSSLDVLGVTEEELEKAPSLGGVKAIFFRDALVPVYPLERILFGGEEEGGRRPVIVLEGFGSPAGFAVSELVEEAELVIKSPPPPIDKYRWILGNGIYRGEVVPLLNTAILVREARGLEIRRPIEREERAPEAAPRVLLVEDNIATRKMLAYLLRAEGFDVVEAQNGMEALEKVRSDVKLVVTDIQMPEMDGFELIRRLKADPELQKIPVVIITTMESEEDRRKGLELGAAAYIVKSQFRGEKLVETIKMLVGR